MAQHRHQVLVDEEGLVVVNQPPLWRRILCCEKERTGTEAAEEPSRLRQDWEAIKKLMPYLWPPGEYLLRLTVVLSLLCLLSAKLCDLFVPIVFRDIINALTPPVVHSSNQTAALVEHAAHHLASSEEESSRGLLLGLWHATANATTGLSYPLKWLLAYGFLKLGSTIFANLRDGFFIKVTQHAIRTVALETFEHLHSLSLRFHLHRRTGGVLRAIERGNSAISTLLTFILFNILPIILEIIMVTSTLLTLFNAWFAVMTLGTVSLYIVFTVVYSEYRNQFRRAMNDADSDANNKAVDSLLNFETVKYFNNDRMEAQRYNHALLNYQAAAITTQYTLAILNVGQSAIIALGLMGVMCYSGWLVSEGEMSVGDLVALNVYVIQLYTPLNFLGTAWRMIRSAIVDMESMFALLDNEIEVVDQPHAGALEVRDGTIEFRNVQFSYSADNPPVLRGISFTVPGGSTLAIVGASGAGKSTITRLLFRFYDATGGQILVDGQDIASVQQHSLRSHIGIVPQDTVLFNDTIAYNLRYARPDCTEAEVQLAARAARIENFIAALPEGFDTKVGERGLRLSGGEKQRVSIARCILKNPPILVLDEATSALDTHTEREIQSSLDEIAANRTTIIVAHRLSTIVHADQILVLKDGLIEERGTHPELLRAGGLYADMWNRQQDANVVDQSSPASSSV